MPILLIGDPDELPRVAKGLDLGATDYLLRPIDRNELVARVRTQVRRKRLQDRLQENYQKSLSLALTDGLTGLYNRRYLTVHLDGLMARAGRGRRWGRRCSSSTSTGSSASTTRTAMPPATKCCAR